MSDKKHAVVELNDGTITSITLDKYLASKMTIIEECSADRITEKTAYWDRIYNPKPEEPDRLKYHFYNARRNLHLWTDSLDSNYLKGSRHKKEYELVDTEASTQL